MENELVQVSLSFPALPFTVLLGLVVIYWIVVILSGLGGDLLDIDLDFDPDTHASLADWGMLGIRWFNLGDVPLMVWVSVLAMSSWLISVTFDRHLTDASTLTIIMVSIRNLGLGMLAAKVMTQPLKGKLKHSEPNPAEKMIGRQGIVTTSEVTTAFGQVECAIVDGAPLKLNVRTLEGAVAKGTTVEIVDYAPAERIYFVKAIG